MALYKKVLRDIFESISGFKIQRLSANSFAIYRDSAKVEAWFSNSAQIEWVIEQFDIDLVIDAGANVGQFAQNLRSFYTGEIISFEPVTDIFMKLKNIAHCDLKWHIYNVALGSENKKVMVNILEESSLSSILKPNNYSVKRFGNDARIKQREEVKLVRLDSLLKDLVENVEHRRIFLKMDTQGYDLEVLKGSIGIKDYIVAIQSEISLMPIYEGMPHWEESLSFYEGLGFKIVGMFPVSRDNGIVIEYDCLMIKA